MKALAFRTTTLLIATFSIAAVSLQAAPSLPITEPPVTSYWVDGPPIDPGSTNGQWFVGTDGTPEFRTHEFHDNRYGIGGGGNADSYAIEGRVHSIQFNALNEITGFMIDATIENDSGSGGGESTDSDNSHGEFRPSMEEDDFYSGPLLDTKLTADFAIADLNLLPSMFTGPYTNPATPPNDSFIIATNEDQRAWYCWNDPPGNQAMGGFYVPTWDFGDIPQFQSTNRTLAFEVYPPMQSSDPRYSAIMAVNEDVFANRTTSLKISTWIDLLEIDDIYTDYPVPPMRSSDVSVFHNAEEEEEDSHKMHFPQWPDPVGWDVRACNYWEDNFQKVLADDFLCTSNGPITHITFWGSYRYNEYGPGVFGGITNFHLSIHRDIPANPPDVPFSKPGGLLWVRNIDPANPPTGWTVTVEPEDPSDQGWYDPNSGQWVFDDHQQYYRYDVYIPSDDSFVQEEGTIYWLDISAKIYQLEGGWGWKTSTEHWNDAAVWADLPVTNSNQWNPLYEPPEFEERIDLAFIIDGGGPGPADDYDFGDAPDPLAGVAGEYPTLLANNGARHKIVNGAPWFGDPSWTELDRPDPEPDGQPDATATGDDTNGATPNDEEGIVIPVMPRGMLSTITIHVGQTGWVDGWIDWNADGKWGPAERVIAQVLPAGSYPLTVPVPYGAAVGVTYARFRIHSPDGVRLGPKGDPTQFGATDDGEVEDHEVFIEEGPFSDAKWLQPPDYSTNGFDVACRLQGDPPILLADDFQCTNHCAITNIVVWGSWRDDQLPSNEPENVNFTLSFHADIPATPELHSMPGETLWVKKFQSGEFSVEPITFDGMQEGWYDPAELFYTPIGDTVCWQYTFPVDPAEAFIQTGTSNRPMIYWLDVQAEPLAAGQAVHFGWKTTRPKFRWNDDAAWTPNEEPYDGPDWWDLHYPQGHPYHQWESNSLDLAFALFCGPEEPVDEFDWGDAPDPAAGTGPGDYRTMAADNGPYHIIRPNAPYFDDASSLLTDAPDGEPDGQQDPQALGDDNDIDPLNPLPNYDDEDGIFIPTLLTGMPGSVDITVNDGGSGAGAYVDAWIDFNGDGTWSTAEQIYSGWMAQGTTTVPFSVPPAASLGQTFARFRINSLAAGLAPTGVWPTGAVPDGEVEDHIVDIEEGPEQDWGDAPDIVQSMIYPTLYNHAGARHVIVPGMFLGNSSSSIDPELDGQPVLPACSGDDNDGNDDEDGVFFTTPLQPGGFAGVDVIASQPGRLDAWIDFNNDGDWADSGERITPIVGQPLAPGVNSLFFGVPTTTSQGISLVSRFRYSNAGGLSYTGLAMDGEVEDHLTPEVLPIEPQGLDWGDAIEPPYPTTTTMPPLNGARHSIVPGIVLGSIVDPEPNGQPHPQAQGDDNDILYPSLGDDEDGIFLPPGRKLVASSNATIGVLAGTGGGALDAWVDFNADGVWADPGEHIFGGVSLGLTPGYQSITFPVPGLPAQALGRSYARFRISAAGSLPPDGYARTGEVEDYIVELCQPGPTTTLIITNQTFDATYAVTTNEWTVDTGIIYQMESSTNLVTGPWIPAGATVIGPLNSQTDNIVVDSNKFYRVTVPYMWP